MSVHPPARGSSPDCVGTASRKRPQTRDEFDVVFEESAGKSARNISDSNMSWTMPRKRTNMPSRHSSLFNAFKLGGLPDVDVVISAAVVAAAAAVAVRNFWAISVMSPFKSLADGLPSLASPKISSTMREGLETKSLLANQAGKVGLTKGSSSGTDH